MGKRSSFERNPRDFYPTPAEAVLPLLPHLAPESRFVEPCAGDGALIRHLEAAGHVCARAYDLEPLADGIAKRNALSTRNPLGTLFITNPPWERGILHPLIRHFVREGFAWLLFDADWMHTVQASAFAPLLRKVVSVGRVKWMPDSAHTGMDNAAWYQFGPSRDGNVPEFHLRRPPPGNPNQVVLFG